MKVLLATLQQKQVLEGVYSQGAVLQFIEDKNGNWVVNENVLNDSNFTSIHEQLVNFPLIDFNPLEVNI
jgi:hypothetical protein